MRVKYLGTGASEGMPGVFCGCALCAKARKNGGKDIRRRCSSLIDEDLLVDLTPDVFFQSVVNKLEPDLIRYLLVTHTHYDHFYPMELRNLCEPYAVRPEGALLRIFGSGEVKKVLEHGLGEFNLQKVRTQMTFTQLSPFEPVEIGPYCVTALKARHCPGAYLYLIEREGRVMLYGTDTGFFPEPTWDYLQGIRVHLVSLDCTSPMHTITPNHMSIEDNVTVRKRMIQQKSADTRTRFVATHFSHSAGYTHEELEERMRLYGFTVAYDGLEITV